MRCYLFALVALLVPAGVHAQTSVTLTGRVSETVALSVSSDAADMQAVSSGNTVRVTLSGTGGKSPVVRVPLLVRSNSSFSISGMVESTTAELAELSIADVHATGTLVAPNAVTQLNTPSNPLDLSRPFLVVTGPRVSLGGTLNSPNNALQITVLILFKAVADDWTAQLILTATK
jgi:hypothetical protein